LAPYSLRSNRTLLSNNAIDGGGRLFDQSWFLDVREDEFRKKDETTGARQTFEEHMER
jgi:hypothetical protein